jgi:hypothetical protein
MPDPKDKASPSRDSQVQQPGQGPAATPEDDPVESTPGVGENQAGFLKERKPTVDGRDRDYD